MYLEIVLKIKPIKPRMELTRSFFLTRCKVKFKIDSPREEGLSSLPSAAKLMLVRRLVKIYTINMGHESNAFSPVPTSLDSFREDLLYLPSTGEGAELPERFKDGDNIGGFALRKGHEVVPGLIAFAQPSQPMSSEGYQTLKSEILNNLKNAMPVDAAILFLHGAHMAHGCDDCEGDILRGVRDIVGPDVPVGIEIDLHGNITEAMINSVDVLIACKEYPHTDFGDRAEELVDIMERVVAGEHKPVIGYAKVPMFGSYFTTREPMRSFVDEIMAMEGRDGILSISLGHGFPWGDFPEAGGSVVVVGDGDQSKAQTLADTLAKRFFAMREEIVSPTFSVEGALDDAIAHPGGPVIIADLTDNPGGGAAGDSTFFLRALLARNITGVAVGMIWDPMAVKFAKMAGVGARIQMRIGGKTSAMSGEPLDVEAKVIALSDDATQEGETDADPLGACAAIEVNGVQIVINSMRQQTYGPECFTQLGIDPKKMKIVVVKSHQHFHARFSPFASKIIYAEAPGSVSGDFHSVPFQRISRPVWPLDSVPFVAFNREWK